MSFEQTRLFVAPVDERTLGDLERAVLDAIDHTGSVTVMQAGRITYRLRGWDTLILIRRGWIAAAGRRVLERLSRLGLVEVAARGRWQRSSPLIGPSVARVVISTLKTQRPTAALARSRAQAAPAHAHDTPANSDFRAVPEPVTSSRFGLGGLRERERYASDRTAPA